MNVTKYTVIQSSKIADVSHPRVHSFLCHLVHSEAKLLYREHCKTSGKA